MAIAAGHGLHLHQWGEGDRTALLLHGQFGDGRMWWQVAPVIAAAGYHVVAPDLPGHGRSKRDVDATVTSTIDDLEATCPAPELAIGHSLGGLVLANGAARFGVERAVFVDTPLRLASGGPPEETRRLLANTKAQRTLDWLSEHRPHWSDDDRRIEADAAENFDVATSLSLVGSLRGADHPPPAGVRSLAVVPDPSEYVSATDVAQLAALGVEVRQIADAGHTVWYGRVGEFLQALEGWF